MADLIKLEFVNGSQEYKAVPMLDENGVVLADHGAITRAVISVGLPGILSSDLIDSIDSNTDTTLFDLTNSTGLKFRLGLTNRLDRGRYLCQITIYTDAFTTGIVQAQIYQLDII